MRLQRLAVLAAAVLFIGPVLADRQKTTDAAETTPPPVAVAQAPVPCDAHCPQGLTLPSPHYIQHPPQYFPESAPKDCATCAARPSERSVVKTYAVADLVVPLPPAGTQPTDKPKTLERELIQKITTTVEPKTWATAGGPGTIEYFPLGLALVVNQTPAVQAAVERYLDTLRKISDVQVVTEMVVLTLSDTWFEKTGLAKAFAGCEGCCKKEDAVRALCVKAEAVRRLIQAAKEDGGIQRLTAPKITTLTGQPGRVYMGETEHFVTGLTVNTLKGNVVFTPKQESHDLGIDLTVCPEVSADGKFVKVAVSGGLKELAARPVRLIPVSTQIQPVSTDGKPGEPVPFTQFIQEPKVVSRTVTGTVTIPDGGTALLYGGKTTIQETTKEPFAFAADVPVLTALFTHDKTETSTNHLLVVLTTHVVRPDACCEECEACSKCDGKLAKLLGEYGRACQEGKVEDARRLAIECLAIDPMCFGKK
jgi:type II/III secretion system protein